MLRDLVIAEVGVAARSLVLAAVGYGIFTLVSGGSFSAVTMLQVALVLFALANVAFAAAKMRKGAFWHAAKSRTGGDD